jgi:hypothetical protein
MPEAQYLAGRILLAMPGMGDPRFDHAVIAMCVHDENGAMGIGIGQPRDGVTLHGLLEDVGIDPGVAPDGPVLRRSGGTIARVRPPFAGLGRGGHDRRASAVRAFRFARHPSGHRGGAGHGTG